MTEDRSIDMFEFVKVLFGKKKILSIVFFVSLITSYLLIYFFIPKEYDSKAMIIVAEENNISSMMKSLKGLPFGLGGSAGSGDKVDLFRTLVFSRSNLEKIIRKFDLSTDYRTTNMSKLVGIVEKKIMFDDKELPAIHITVRSLSIRKAYLMSTFIVEELNKFAIDLETKKSRTYRQFVEKRYFEIKSDLRKSEDKLTSYQKANGIIDKAQRQAELIVENLVDIEKIVIAKQMELSIKEKMLPSDAPYLGDLKIELKEYQKKLDDVRINGNPGSPILAINSLPDKIKDFVRLYREVEIQNAMLEYISPLYEQAKMDEQKDMPLIQVIDKSNIPDKRSAPKRTILAGLFSLGILFMLVLWYFYKYCKSILFS